MNKRMLLISAVVGLLALGGGGFAYYSMKMNKEAFRGYPIPVKGVPEKMVENWVEGFEQVTKDEEFLTKLVEDSNYAEVLELSDTEAVDRLRETITLSYEENQDRIVLGLTEKIKYQDDLEEVMKLLLTSAQGEVAYRIPSFQSYMDQISQAR